MYFSFSTISHFIIFYIKPTFFRSPFTNSLEIPPRDTSYLVGDSPQLESQTGIIQNGRNQLNDSFNSHLKLSTKSSLSSFGLLFTNKRTIEVRINTVENMFS